MESILLTGPTRLDLRTRDFKLDHSEQVNYSKPTSFLSGLHDSDFSVAPEMQKLVPSEEFLNLCGLLDLPAKAAY